jgi:hypothetical protein
MRHEHPEHGRCPHCNSVRLHKSGTVYVREGPRQRYYCRACHRTTIKPKLQLNLPLDGREAAPTSKPR